MRKLLVLMLLIPCVAIADVTVGAGRDYESFTQAVYETVDSGETITVYPGEYDIHAEYNALFGEDVPGQFQRGIFLHDRDVVFMPGSKLVCVWDRSDNFSVLYSGGNVTLDGMNLYAEGMLYAIHDDLWHWTEPYVNEYRRCRVIGRLLKNANIIGGGVAQNARIIIDSCWFDNGVDDSITVRYHNVDLPDAKGDIWVSDSWFNGYLAMCYYGGSAHLDVYVNGSRAKKIELKAETPDQWLVNIDLYKWGNEEQPSGS
jgi:hypothetical protein